MKNYKTALAVSLGVIIITAAISAISVIAGITIPDMGTRIIGIADLIALPVAAFTAVKIYTASKR